RYARKLLDELHHLVADLTESGDASPVPLLVSGDLRDPPGRDTEALRDTGLARPAKRVGVVLRGQAEQHPDGCDARRVAAGLGRYEGLQHGVDAGALHRLLEPRDRWRLLAGRAEPLAPSLRSP